MIRETFLKFKPFDQDFDPRFKIFHELMAKKIRDILLVSTQYDAWIMEEDCRLSEQIIKEYRGLNLSNPPRLSWVSTMEEAVSVLDEHHFDMVIIMLRFADREAYLARKKIRKRFPDLPIILLSHNVSPTQQYALYEDNVSKLDRRYLWTGNTEILLALIKSTEDRMNVAHDTDVAGIRVIIFVEDSPGYISAILPILYKELVIQAQAVMEEGLNEEHRLLAMRARPKILLAESYDEALELYEQFKDNLLSVISDVRIPRNGKIDDHAGIDLLKKIKKERFDIPLLVTSNEPGNAEEAAEIPASFVDKNSPSLPSDVRPFFARYLGFGDFVFRMPDGKEIARAGTVRALENHLKEIPDESFIYHCNKNDFSRWLFARAEIDLASVIRPIRKEHFADIQSHRQHLISTIHSRRMQRQKGVIVNFDPKGFDRDTEFLKIGTGSVGGKARGLAFISALLQKYPRLSETFDKVRIYIPQTLVITTDGFEEFVEKNRLGFLATEDLPDEEVASRFMDAEFPSTIADQLNAYLTHMNYPLAARSSSLLEDAQFRAYAGLYKTYMLSNDDEDLRCRLEQLINAIKMVYASTYFQGPKTFARRVGQRTEEEKMAVIIQPLVGENYNGYFYPAISGVAQSNNFYPFSKMKPEEGVVSIALGLGKSVMDGEASLRFSPKYPQILPERATVDDILKNAQRYFYSLKLGNPFCQLGVDETVTLEKREVSDAGDELPVTMLSSTYIQEEHRIRDSYDMPGYKVLTFNQILKYDLFQLPALLQEILTIGKDGMGCPIEMEFSVNLGSDETKPHFAILQIRPMGAREELMDVDISEEEKSRAFCFSNHSLGNTINQDMADIIYVKPDSFDPKHTVTIAREIGRMNADLFKQGRKYLLIGPGRWGSADRWLGIPVAWEDICGVGAIVETAHAKLKAELSQGSHFFHNITSLGIIHITVTEPEGDYLKWDWLTSMAAERELDFVSHVRLDKPFTLKVDGKLSRGVLFNNNVMS